MLNAAPLPPAASGAASKPPDRAKFEAWARLHLGRGYGFETDEGTYLSSVTKWAEKAFTAGRALPKDKP